jgi:hypothetical protein
MRNRGDAMKREQEILKPEGKLGVLIPGIGGAVGTTFWPAWRRYVVVFQLPLGL